MAEIEIDSGSEDTALRVVASLERFVDTRSLYFLDPATGLAIYDRGA